MRIYFERQILCGCGRTQRQTAKTLPLDEIGQALADRQLKRFKRKHSKEECRKEIKYTSWILKE